MKHKESNSRFSMRKQKSYLTVGVITLVALIAMAGIFYKKTVDDKADEQEAVIMAQTEWTEDSDADNETVQEEASEENEEESTTDGKSVMEDTSGNSLQDTISQEGKTEGIVETLAASDVEKLQFSESDQLGWPLSGDVILNYSMDQSVYFATLDQYKYNPALVIAGAVNDKVTAAADGQVLSIKTTAETGETVTVDIGNGYQLVYGQLKDVQFSEGDYMEKGALIGFVSEPTKYYSMEGSNLYFEMLKDGEPVNPMNYLE